MVLLVSCGAAGAEQPGTRIVIAGDSTASAYSAERRPRTGWGEVLPSFLDLPVVNRAVSGRSTRSYIAEGRLEKLRGELRPGDLLLIQFGHNDAKREDPARYAEASGAYADNLLRFATAARAAGATPVLLTPVARRAFDRDGVVVDTHRGYADAVRALARRERLALVDLGLLSMNWLRELGAEASKAYYLHLPGAAADDTHTHARGASAIACMVASDLVAQDLVDRARARRDLDCVVRDDGAARHATQARPSLVQHAAEIAEIQPAPHGGDGETVAAPYFRDAPSPPFVFRQRTLRPGASIGLHVHSNDEVYYVVAGRGQLTLDGKVHALRPGTAVLTRTGSTHSLRQEGQDDLVIVVAYPAR